MASSDSENNIYNTRSPGDKDPEKEYADLPLTKARYVTRNKILTGILLGGSSFVFAAWFALIYRSPDRDDSKEDGVDFEPELISLQQGVVVDGNGQTNTLVSGFNVDAYLPDTWGSLPDSDRRMTDGIQVLNPIARPAPSTPETKDNQLIIETNDVPTLLAQVAEQFIRDGKIDLAEEQLKVALAQRPDDTNCLHLLGTIYASRGEHEKAISHYKDLIIRNPYKEDYYNNLAVAYMRAGRLEEAEAELKTALKTDGNYHDAHINLAILYRQQDRNDLVVKQLEPIIGDIPEHVNAQKYLAYALLAIGEPYRARAHFVELVRLVPDQGDYYLRVAECYAQENTPEKAAAWLKLSTDHATELEIKQALLRAPFERIKDQRSIKMFTKSLDKKKGEI